MKDDKGFLHHYKLLFLLVSVAIAGASALPAKAVTAPDSFREKVIDVTAHCYPVFDRLSDTYWPDRDPAEVSELKQDARVKRDYALDMLRRYSEIYSNFNLNQVVAQAEKELGVNSASKDSLLDMAVHCENEIFKLIDEEAEKGYTP